METMLAPTGIKALRQKQAELRGSLRLLLDGAKEQRRDLSDEEAQIYTSRKAELEKNSARLAIAEDELERQRSDGGGHPVGEEYNSRTRTAAFPRNNPTIKGGRRYAEMFGASSLSNDGWESPEEFFRVLHSGLHDPRLRPASMQAAMNESQPVGGGFFVPSETIAQLLDQSLEGEIVRSRCQMEPMKYDTKRVASWDASDSSSGALYGGISAVWAQETVAQNTQQPKVRLIQLTANKLLLLIQVSNELIADGENFESLLSAAIIKASSWHVDAALINGDGAGKPLGILNSKSVIVIPKETGQASGTILYANVAKMAGAMHPACFGNSIWLVNPTALPQLLQMTLNVRNQANTDNVGGSATPILSQDGDTFRMLTRPVILTEKVPALSAQSDVTLCDVSQYICGLRMDATLEKSAHAGFSSDTSFYRLTLRIDGQAKWAQAYKPRNGSPTSWCVTLGAR